MVGGTRSDTCIVLHLWEHHTVFMEALMMSVYHSRVVGGVVGARTARTRYHKRLLEDVQVYRKLECGRERSKLSMPPQESCEVESHVIDNQECSATIAYVVGDPRCDSPRWACIDHIALLGSWWSACMRDFTLGFGGLLGGPGPWWSPEIR